MRIPPARHSWDVPPREAIQIQRDLAAELVRSGDPPVPHLVAGCDLAFSRDGQACLAAVVVWDVREQEVVEQQVARRPVAFPYVPGLLSFREGPALLAALEKIRSTPDILMFDGQGYAHPRRCGLASHIGLLLDHPSLGCAKSVLVGEYTMPAETKGSWTPMYEKGEIVARALRTRDHVKPVFISVGHRLSLKSAMRIALVCTTRYRLPEPTRLADRLVAEARRQS